MNLMSRILAVLVAVALTAPTALANSKKNNVSLTATLSNTHVLMPGQGRVHLAIDLKALEAKSDRRLPMNVSLVIDRSGSMRGDKIAHTRAAAKHLVSQLNDQDTLSIVSYSDDVRVDLPASRVDAEVKRNALAAISRIRAGGSTNLSGGLFRGQSEVERNVRQGQVNRVLLMSDGLANRGIIDTAQLARRVQQASQRGLSVTTLGVGTDYNEDLMTAVADHGGGNYYFIESPKAIASVFNQELSRMFATVAQNARIELNIEDGAELKNVFGYTHARKGDVVSIPLSEIFGGQRRSILVELQIPVARSGRAVLGSVTLIYDDVVRESKVKTDVALAVQVTSSKDLVDKGRDRSVEERIEEVKVATVVTQAADMLRDGRGNEARRMLQEKLKDTASRSRAMGGSKRLDAQVRQLEQLDQDFEATAEAPAAAPRLIKAAKQKAYQQVK
jgi:Ca-activated chloride channel family protein